MATASSHRGQVEGYKGLWWRTLKDGTIVYEAKLRGLDGVLRSKTLGKSKNHAISEWRKMTVKRDEKIEPIAHSKDLGDVAEEFFADMLGQVERGQRSRRTYNAYKGDWNNYLAPRLGKLPLGKIRKRTVLDTIAWLREQPGRDGQKMAEWSVNGKLTPLRAIFRFARNRDYMSLNPFGAIDSRDLPSQEARDGFQHRVLRDYELAQLLAAVQPEYLPLVITLVFTGMRRSEAAGLLWSDVDLTDGVIRLRKQLAPLAKGEEPMRVKLKDERMGKKKKQPRDIIILPRLAQALETHLSSEIARGFGDLDDFVFTAEAGRPIEPTLITDAVIRASEKTKAGRITPQDLRCTAATVFASAGIQRVVAAQMLGHTPEVYDANYVQAYQDAEERERTRAKLLDINFGGVPEEEM